ncbi:MAG TPA: BsuPI-related putative proteinase inhibitor [Gemmatimonadaceae bacterium]|nr:BsuPI-related putative proteinase inhibitor [Gemmatimonadaceae bacterium]
MWMRTLATTAALAAACTSHTSSPTAADGSGSPTVDVSQPADVAVRVDASPAAVAPSGSLHIVVTVTNTDDERHVIEASSGCFTDFELLDARGDVVTRSLQLCPAMMASRTLDPGESFSETHVWKRGLRGMPELPAGTYRVRGILLARTSPVASEAVDVVLTPGG